jgi:8-oxo-dGTP pyrophosphatase MutT (NUDIX family)
VAKTLIPRPAATVLPVREGPQGYEILMLRRNLRSDFIGGAYVFPGGAVDEGDGEFAHRIVGPSEAAASKRLNLEGAGLSYYVACLRELFEEAGLLITCEADGAPRRFDAEDVVRLSARRQALNAGEIDFLTFLDTEDLFLDLRGVEYLAHWVTPVGPPRRYDTRFFVALAPEGQLATHDALETDASRWLRPCDALEAQRRGAFEMIFPTIRTFESIAHFASARAVLEHARELVAVQRIEPRFVERDGAVVILTPGDEGFESAGS